MQARKNTFTRRGGRRTVPTEGSTARKLRLRPCIWRRRRRRMLSFSASSRRSAVPPDNPQQHLECYEPEMDQGDQQHASGGTGSASFPQHCRFERHVARIMSAALSAIISVAALMLAEGIVGMIDASTTRRPSSPGRAAGRPPRGRVALRPHAAGAHGWKVVVPRSLAAPASRRRSALSGRGNPRFVVGFERRRVGAPRKPHRGHQHAAVDTRRDNSAGSPVARTDRPTVRT